MNYTLEHVYKYYRSKGGTIGDYKIFRDICCEFNQYIMERIIEFSETFKLGSHLGYLYVAYIRRKKGRLMIDWGATNKKKQQLLDDGIPIYDKENNPEGEKYFVYYENDAYCSFHWSKTSQISSNAKYLNFTPTGGKVGNKTKLTKHLKENPEAELSYIQVKYGSE